MPVSLKGSTSGEVTLTAPAVAGTTSITLPAITGTAVVANPSGDFSVSGLITSAYVSTSAAYPQFNLYSSTGTANQRSFRLQANDGNLFFMGVTDAGVQTTFPMTIGWNGSVGMETLRFNNGYGSSAIAYGCRAWVNFNGTGTVVINGSGNVSSITDRGIGAYTVNFTTAITDANYSVSGMFKGDANGGQIIIDQTTDPATGGVQIQTRTQAGSLVDRNPVCVSLFR